MKLETAKTDNIALIDNIRYVLLIGVILIHCNITGFTSNAGFGADFVRFISSGLCSVCVPFYFMISAFLFFRAMDRFSFSWYYGKIKRRFFSLLVPYLLWNTIGFVILLLKMQLISDTDFTQYANLDISAGNILKGFWSLQAIDGALLPYPYDFVLWFVRDLIVLTLLSPVFYLAARFAGWLFLAVLFILSFFDPCIPLPVTEIFFFYSGCFIALRKVRFNALCRHGKWLVFPSLLLAVIPMITDLPDTVNKYFPYILSAIPVLCRTVSFLIVKYHAIPKSIIASGFFIYAFHGLYVTVASKLSMTLIAPDSPIACICCYFLDFCLILSIAIGGYLIFHLLLPRFTIMLSGGRR